MKHSEDRFSGQSGEIYFQCWEPDIPPRALVLLAHGGGEHSGRYHALASFFTAQGYAVAALDHAGHGRSDGRYGYVESFDEYLLDLNTFHRKMSAQFSSVPVFLLGHSMGGLIAANYLLRHQQGFVGAVVTGPLIQTELQPGAVQTALIRLLAVLLPRLGMIKLDATGVSRDSAVVQQYEEDPLVNHSRVSVRMLRELFVGMNSVAENASAIELPMLILHGEQDVMTAPAGSQFLHDHISSRDKQLKIYPGLYHEIFNEPERDEVRQDVLEWCDARLTPNPEHP